MIKNVVVLCLLKAGLLMHWVGFVETAAAQSAPATAREAAAVLDLSQLELIQPIDEPNARAVARQSYRSKGKVLEIGEAIRKNLKEAGCEEVDGAMFTESYGSAVYRKAGFAFSLTIYPGGQPDEVTVGINNHGNVDLKTLPVPEGATEKFALPSMVSYLAEGSVEEVNQGCRERLKQHGWEPFGETTVSFFVKQNAVILQVMVSAAPAFEGKTMIQFSSEQMSVDLPAPPYSEVMQYSDPGNMLFDSERTQLELIEFFKTELGKTEWKATTDNPIKIDFREHLIFRNPSKEYLELDFQTVEGKTRTRIKYLSAKDFAESEKRAEESLKKK
jgi:hypothetical protein